ncbi:MAG: hemB [Phycisphaerales bacterium]|nr:hemB [Phycisphaerales bacterium]
MRFDNPSRLAPSPRHCHAAPQKPTPRHNPARRRKTKPPQPLHSRQPSRIIPQMPDPLDLPIRPRRLRLRPDVRAMLQQVTLRRSDFIVPLFVTEGSGVRKEVASMPGVFQMSVDVASAWLARRAEEGFKSYLAFGVIERGKKDPAGSAALDADNVVCRLLREVSRQQIPMAGNTDLCFCEYTSHGH